MPGQPGAVMKTLLFLRHAKAEPGGSDDHERSLTPDGETAARNVGLLLARTEARPDVVVTSTALRARQTLACAREAGHWSAPVQAVRDLYEAKSRRVLEEIQYVPEPSQTVLLIGHEPAWSRTVCRLTGGSDLHFPAGTLARVQTNARVWADVGFGRCELVWLMPPAVVAFLVAGS